MFTIVELRVESTVVEERRPINRHVGARCRSPQNRAIGRGGESFHFEFEQVARPEPRIDARLATAIDLMKTATDLLTRHHRTCAFGGRHTFDSRLFARPG